MRSIAQYAIGTVLPSHEAASALDQATTAAYEIWKERHLVAGCKPGEYRVESDVTGCPTCLGRRAVLEPLLLDGRQARDGDVLDRGGVPEVVSETTGVLVEYGDVPGIARAAVAALEREWKADDFARHLEQFSYPVFRDRLATLLST